MSGRTIVDQPSALGPQLIALFGGAIAWTLHLLVSWPLVSAACELSGGILILHGATLITAAVAIASAGVSWTAWRSRDDRDTENMHPILRDRVVWIGVSGVILNLLFAAAILLAGVPNFFIEPCQGIQ